MQEDLERDNGHSSDLDHKRRGTLLVWTIHRENGTVAVQMLLTIAESQHEVFRSIVQRSAQEQRWWKLSIQYCSDPGTIETVLRTIIYVNQLSIHGAVEEMCEECESCTLMEQGDLLWKDNPTHCSCQG